MLLVATNETKVSEVDMRRSISRFLPAVALVVASTGLMPVTLHAAGPSVNVAGMPRVMTPDTPRFHRFAYEPDRAPKSNARGMKSKKHKSVSPVGAQHGPTVID
jgi:hypothetical protein